MSHKEINVKDWELPAGRVATRAAVRFPLQLPLRLHTEDGVIEAVTENVSSSGLLFTASALPRIGSAIEFTMTMPGHVMGMENDVAIHCFGRIVRHQIADRSMAAAVIDEYFLQV